MIATNILAQGGTPRQCSTNLANTAQYAVYMAGVWSTVYLHSIFSIRRKCACMTCVQIYSEFCKIYAICVSNFALLLLFRWPHNELVNTLEATSVSVIVDTVLSINMRDIGKQ